MHRCFIEPKRWSEHDIVPSASEAHHLCHVLRAGDGDAVAVFDGAGREARATVRIAGNGELTLKVAESRAAPERSFEICLIQAIPKGSRMDFIVEKATEIGVGRIIPVMTDHGVVRLDAKQAGKRANRWDRIARGAAKQCGTPWLPKIDPVKPYRRVLEETAASFDAMFVGSLVDGVQPLHVAIDALRGQAPSSVAVIIGPEGDLTAAETAAALDAGALPVSFGALTLRVETAALYAAAVLAYEFL